MKPPFWILLVALAGLIELRAGGQGAAPPVPETISPLIAPQIPRPTRSDYAGLHQLLVTLYEKGVLDDAGLARATARLRSILVFTAGEVDQRPVLLSRSSVMIGEIPRSNQTAELVFDFIVGPDGGVYRIRELNGNIPALVLVYMRSISTWRYSPGIKNGQPVATELQFRTRLTMRTSYVPNFP